MHKSRRIWRKSRITHSVYSGNSRPIRAWCDSWFAIRQFPTTSGFCTNHQRARTWFALIYLWCVYLYTLFVHFGGFLVYSGSFSTQVGCLTISWSVCDCLWWFADGCANHEFDEFMNSVQRAVHGDSQFICANGALISDLCESCTVYSRHYNQLKTVCLGSLKLLQQVPFSSLWSDHGTLCPLMQPKKL